MKIDKKFPEWILEAVNKNKNQLNPKSIDFFEKFLRLYLISRVAL